MKQLTLVASDLSNIEGRGLAYLAEEAWKLEAFRAFDAGTGPDLYNITATSIIGGDPWAVAKADRNVFGKVPDLACGYGGGPGAFETFEKAYGVNMLDHWPTIRQNVPVEHIEKARYNHEAWGRERAPDTPQALWVARETVKLAWRARHPATCRLWRAAEQAARDALENPGQTFGAGPHLKFGVRCAGGHRYLLVRLPSGRYLTYFDPRKSEKGTLSYMGMGDEGAGTAKVWCRLHTYGGKIVENCTQAFARDVLAYNMPAIEDAGYRIVLTVHDEVVTEAGAHGSAEELSALLAHVPSWAATLPLSAEGFEAQRYRKG